VTAVLLAVNGAVLERHIHYSTDLQGASELPEDTMQLIAGDVKERGAGPDPIELLDPADLLKCELPYWLAGVS
jgi:hypothetical protein